MGAEPVTHVSVWWYVLSAANIIGMAAVVSLLCVILGRQRKALSASGSAAQAVGFPGSLPWGETVHTTSCPFADTCDRVNCRMEGAHPMLAAEGGFGDPVCAKCGGPARLIESKTVAVPEEWRDLMRFADAVACDRCGFVSEGEVPFISLEPRLRSDEEMLRAAIGAAARELARRVVECDRLKHLNLDKGPSE